MNIRSPVNYPDRVLRSPVESTRQRPESSLIIHVVGQDVQRHFGADVLIFIWKCVEPALPFRVCFRPSFFQQSLAKGSFELPLPVQSPCEAGYAGCAIADLGDGSRGAEILQQAVEIDPSNAQAHVALGAALGAAGDLDGAIARMRHGIKLSPRDRRLGFWGACLVCT